MRKDRIWWINPGTWPVYLGFCPTKKAWKREMLRLKVPKHIRVFPDTDASVQTFTKNGRHIAMLVLVSKRMDTRSANGVIGLLAHEAAHVWQHVKEEMKDPNPSAETEAYALQYITQQLVFAYTQTRRQIFK